MSLITIVLSFLLLNNNPVDLSANAPGNSTKTATLKGKVVSYGTGEELIGVEIKILGTGKSVYTGLDGEFEITDLGCEHLYTLEISYISFSGKIIRGINPVNNNLIIRLKKNKITGNNSLKIMNPKT